MRTQFLGYVIGTAMQKTIKVRVERIKIHPIVKKPVRMHKNFMAHDENETCVVGDYVKIEACQKISKRKHFKLLEIVKPAQRVVDSEGRLVTQKVEMKTQPSYYNIDQYK